MGKNRILDAELTEKLESLLQEGGLTRESSFRVLVDGLAGQLDQGLQELGATQEDIRRLVDPQTLDLVIRFVRDEGQLLLGDGCLPIRRPAAAEPEPEPEEDPPGTYTVTVDPDRTIAELVKDADFEQVHSDIIEWNFPDPPPQVGRVRLHLVGFNMGFTTKAVISELDSLGLRPAVLREGLAFVCEYPELLRPSSIAMLGSVRTYSDDFRAHPYTFGSFGKHILNLSYSGSQVMWSADCQFLAACK